jgi:haloacetate dehalogenase
VKGFGRFDVFDVDLGAVTVHGRVSHSPGRDLPPLLLLHGHPQTHVMWHKVADRLAEHFTVVAADLRGYGDSSRPASDARHTAYSKRVMAQDQVDLMARLGFDRFAVCAHDRGARVTHRMLVDHPARVSRALLLDIAPTLDMYAGTDRAFAEAYFHWFFLIQPAPLPEVMITADPANYVRNLLGSRHAGLAPFTDEALAAYEGWLASDGAARAMCEDYRASATIDLDHEREDRQSGRMITAPLRVLWGRNGVVGRLFEPLTLWQQLAVDVTGRDLDCGHYLAEEQPDEVHREVLDHLGG